jgi:uncharacterized membrane protein YczE
MLGFLIFGLGIALMVSADLGLDPWSAFHDGLTKILPISFGTANIAAGLVLLAIGALALQQRIDWGTALNMLLIGVWSDVFLALLQHLPPIMELHYAARWFFFLLGVALVALASGMYISSRWGDGPRDGFVLRIAARTGSSVRLVRSLLELTVLGLGLLLGSRAGWGTIAFALLIGPGMQAALRLFHALPSDAATEAAAAAAD